MEENKANPAESQLKSVPRYSAKLLGSVSMGQLYPQSMQPWVMAEIHRKKGSHKEVLIEIVEDVLRVIHKNENLDQKSTLLFEHPVRIITRFAKLHQDPRCFAYLTKSVTNTGFQCHVFFVEDSTVISQLFLAIREASKSVLSKSPSGDLCDNSDGGGGGDADASKSLFEVKFVGGTKVGGRRVTADYIDSLAEKMIAREEERRQMEERRIQQVDEWRRIRHESEASIQSLPDTLEDVADHLTIDNKLGRQTDMLQQGGARPGQPEGGTKLGVRADEDMATGQTADLSHRQQKQAAYTDSASSSRDYLNMSEDPGASESLVSSSHTAAAAAGTVGCRRRHSSLREESSTGQQKVGQSGSRQSLGSSESLDGCRTHESNRIMVLQVGQQEITLISLDKKVAVLECKFKDISFLSQGSNKKNVFGVVVRQSGTAFSCYIFKCLTDNVVAEIMSTLQVAFTTAYNQGGSSPNTPQQQQQQQRQQQVCAACPLHQLHQICQEISALSPQLAYELLVKKVQHLPEVELCELNSCMQAEAPGSLEESVEVMMIYLHQVCERRQKEHVHTTDSSSRQSKAELLVFEERHNNNKIFEGIKNKAKRSLTSSFENLISRSKRRDSLKEEFKIRSLTTDSDVSFTSRDSSLINTSDGSPVPSPMNKNFPHDFPSPPTSPPHPLRQRSATLDSVISSNYYTDQQLTKPRDVNHNKTAGTSRLTTVAGAQLSERVPSVSCLLDEAVVRGVTKDEAAVRGGTKDEATVQGSPRRASKSWRKAIFNRACTPQHSQEYDEGCFSPRQVPSSVEMRALWKKAFLESLLLIRLEKEKQNIRARQEEGGATLSRKLEYQELTPCLKEITGVWEKVLSLTEAEDGEEEEDSDDEEEEEARGEGRTITQTRLVEYVRKGVPQTLRGQIWLYLMQQMAGAMPDSICEESSSYEELLKQLTTHQHAILIDLGRTFPNQAYFSRSLGPGQLELFNLLKAYSLLDTEVGYCQGLSFIVGVLLMHMEEISAFHVLKYLMYDLGLRRQFRPNMVALQIKLYQLTRLLHDHYKDLYNHFEAHDISPTLYAAPWFLTMFASQFPLGFVARVFDMIFVQGISALFKVALTMLGNHRALILQCDTFESIVDFLKVTLPEMVQVQMERIINQAFDLDIDGELQAYQVEYHVLSEETDCFPASGHENRKTQPSFSEAVDSQQPKKLNRRSSIDLEMLYRLEHQNQALRKHNVELLEKLQSAQSEREGLEVSLLAQHDEQEKLKSHIRVLELERTALLSAVAKLRQLLPQETLQSLALILPASPSAPPPALASGETYNMQEEAHIMQAETHNIQAEPSCEKTAPIPNFVPSSSVADNELSGDTAPTQACSSSVREDTEQQTEGRHPQKENTTKISQVLNSSIPVTCACAQTALLTTHTTVQQHVCELSSASSCASTQETDQHRSMIQPSTNFSLQSNTSFACMTNTTTQTVVSLQSNTSHTSMNNSTTQPVVSLQPQQSNTSAASSVLTYTSRTISNVSSSLPPDGSLTPEQRRRAVKVVVQQSFPASSTQPAPSSQR